MEVSVADEGVRIAPDEMDHLFDRPHQIERDEMEQGGLVLFTAAAGHRIVGGPARR